MVVPGGAVGGGQRVAGGLVALGAALTVVATFLPIHGYGSAVGSSRSEFTIGAWANSYSYDGKTTTNPVWPTGVWLVLVALVAVAAAVALFATAARPGPRARTFGAFGAGILAAAATAQCVPAVTGLLLAADAIEYHLAAGWILLLVAAIVAVAGGIVAITTGPRAGTQGPWAPGQPAPPPWGPPPGAAPMPHQAGPFPPQPPGTGGFPAQQYPPFGPPRT
jgi:hypothetical protein